MRQSQDVIKIEKDNLNLYFLIRHQVCRSKQYNLNLHRLVDTIQEIDLLVHASLSKLLGVLRLFSRSFGGLLE